MKILVTRKCHMLQPRFVFFYFIYIYSNTKFLLGLPDNNKKNHYENIKKPFEASFNYFFFF